jgi:hypothetical protein
VKEDVSRSLRSRNRGGGVDGAAEPFVPAAVHADGLTTALDGVGLAPGGRRFDPAEAPVRISGAQIVGIGVVLLVPPIWLLSLRHVDLTRMTDIGLVSVLPRTTFVLAAVTTVSFLVLLFTRPASTRLLFLHVLVLMLVLFATPSVVEAVPRLGATWRHVGIADYITRTGRVDATIDAYFDWPAFFIGLSFVTKMAGLSNAVALARWAPIFLNLLYLPPLFVLLRQATDDRRIVWLAVWIFYSANWVGQDYLSPQGFSYFLYLTVLALLLRFFVDFERRRSAADLVRALETWTAASHAAARRLRPLASAFVASFRRLPLHRRVPWSLGRPARAAAAPSSSGPLGVPLQRAQLMAVAIVVSAVTVPMHQLTPFALLIAVTALAVLGFSSARRLPVILAVLILAWLVFMASAYLAGHFGGVVKEVGDVQGSLNSNLGARIAGSPGHLTVVIVRLGMTAVLWLLAAAGLLAAPQRGTRVLAVLAFAPFLLLALQSYGGEVLLRIYLFALPAISFLAAAMLVRMQDAAGWRSSPVLAAMVVALVGGCLVTRYGNEKMDAFTKTEVGAVDAIYARAAPRSLIIAGSSNMPWDFEDYEKHDLLKIVDISAWRKLDGTEATNRRLLVEIEDLMRDRQKSPSAFLVLTRSQVAETDLFATAPRGSLTRLWRAVAASADFRAVYSQPDAAVYVIVPKRERR